MPNRSEASLERRRVRNRCRMAELRAQGYFAEWAQAHAESETARKRRWRHEHPDAVRESTRRYRARRRRRLADLPDPHSLIAYQGELVAVRAVLAEDLAQERALARLTGRPRRYQAFLRAELRWLARTVSFDAVGLRGVS